MPRGALVVNGVVVAVISAGSGAQPAYQLWNNQSADFVPDNFCNVGDTYNGSTFTYSASAVPPPITLNQFIEACTVLGFLPQLQTIIAGMTGTAQNAWNGTVPLNDTTVQSLRTASGMTVQQSLSFFKFAATLTP